MIENIPSEIVQIRRTSVCHHLLTLMPSATSMHKNTSQHHPALPCAPSVPVHEDHLRLWPPYLRPPPAASWRPPLCCPSRQYAAEYCPAEGHVAGASWPRFDFGAGDRLSVDLHRSRSQKAGQVTYRVSSGESAWESINIRCMAGAMQTRSYTGHSRFELICIASALHTRQQHRIRASSRVEYTWRRDLEDKGSALHTGRVCIMKYCKLYGRISSRLQWHQSLFPSLVCAFARYSLVQFVFVWTSPSQPERSKRDLECQILRGRREQWLLWDSGSLPWCACWFAGLSGLDCKVDVNIAYPIR